MSATEPDDLDGVFCDTSVLLDYVFDQGRDGTRALLIEKDNPKVISKKVKQEFEKVPERKEEIYLDFIDIITSDSDSIADAKVSERDYLKTNDVGFFRELQDTISDAETEQEQLRVLREQQKIVDRRWGQVEQVIDDICEQNDDVGLILKLQAVVSNEDDVQVICDGARWAHNGGSGRVTTLDFNDIINNREDINDRISDHNEKCAELEIAAPDEIV
mgnify:CR=1 FL=1